MEGRKKMIETLKRRDQEITTDKKKDEKRGRGKERRRKKCNKNEM